jgi:hypothetical protein
MADAPERVWIAEDEIGNPWWSTAPDEEMDEYTRTDLARAAVAEAIAAGVRAGLRAAADMHEADCRERQREGDCLAWESREDARRIRAIASNSAHVAAIAAQAKGGANG